MREGSIGISAMTHGWVWLYGAVYSRGGWYQEIHNETILIILVQQNHVVLILLQSVNVGRHGDKK